jgi:hypothetical protein
MKALGKTLVALAASVIAGSVYAGPYILAGTDADDHGSATATANEEGWLFMQKALENLAASPNLTNTNKTVIALGSSTGTALTAATSAFNFSSLASSGWSFVSVPDRSSLPGGASFASVIGAGSIPVLATGIGNASNLDVIIGSAGGSFTEPEPPPVAAIPEPETYALMLAGLGLVGAVARRRRPR